MRDTRSYAATVALFALCSCSNGAVSSNDETPSSNLIRVGQATYLFPNDSRVTIKTSYRKGSNFISFDVGDENDGRPTEHSITLEYDQSFNDSYVDKRSENEPWVKSGFPRVRWLVYGAKHGDLFVLKKPWGEVLCDRSSIGLGMYLACGSEFEEAGAAWQVLFHNNKMRENTNIIAEAKASLRSIKVSDRPVGIIM